MKMVWTATLSPDLLLLLDLLILGIIRAELANFFPVLDVTFIMCGPEDPLSSIVTSRYRVFTGFSLNPSSVKVMLPNPCTYSL